MFWLECGLVSAAVLVVLPFPQLGARWFALGEHAFIGLASRRRLSVLFVWISALLIRVALLPIEPIPQPTIHDEFSYLLMSDTFARGRVANPAHPLWVHFESFHINQKPTYISKYPLAQGLFLAAGQRILGSPFWGVWLSVGLMCAAICWMLQGWLRPSWALVGGLLAVIRLGSFSYWANSYFGGAVAALGGALVLGALPRLKKSQGVTDSVLMGIGFGLLANSRPYEGLVFSLPIAAALLIWVWRSRQLDSRTRVKVLAPLALVLITTACAMLYYFWRTTGNAFLTPYQVNQEAYDPVPPFLWQSLRAAPQYHHAEMQKFYLGWQMPAYEYIRAHFFEVTLWRILYSCLFFLGPSLMFPLIVLISMVPARELLRGIYSNFGFLTLVLAVSAFGMLWPVYFGPHYVAPLTCLIYALIVLAMQTVRHRTRRGVAMVRIVPVTCVAMLLLRATGSALGLSTPGQLPLTWCSPHLYAAKSRASVSAKLDVMEGRQLAIVRYDPDHNPAVDWVYNDADIDSSKLVWARDMGAQNEELIQYYKNRQVWLVEPDTSPPRISRYPTSTVTSQNVSQPGNGD
jgi:hypothetical protein